MTAQTALLLTHALATLFMTGLIWFVQIVHYPLMASVGAARFTDYETRHMRRTTWVVGPGMLVEAAAAVALLISPPAGAATLAWIGAALLAVIWLSTALLQAPRHRRLIAGFDERLIRSLVAGNWIRTAAWSARSAIALALLAPHAAS